MHNPSSTSAPEQSLPTVDEILADPSTSFWLILALKEAMQRDPLDAALDAQVLSLVLNQRLDSVTAQHRVTGPGA